MNSIGINWNSRYLEEEKENRRNSALVTLVILILLTLILFLVRLISEPTPPPEPQGLEVALGGIDGMGETPAETPSADPASAPQESEEVSETQDVEDAPELNNEKQTNVTTPVKTPEERKVDPRATYPSKKQGETGQGNTGQTGNQGKPDGTTGAPDGDGSGLGLPGGKGGRGVKKTPVGEATCKNNGIVRVRMKVDRSGKVVQASHVVAGSSILDPVCVKEAVELAKLYEFQPDADAPEFIVDTVSIKIVVR